jgi:hypothetical protein
MFGREGMGHGGEEKGEVERLGCILEEMYTTGIRGGRR